MAQAEADAPEVAQDLVILVHHQVLQALGAPEGAAVAMVAVGIHS